MRGHKTRRTTAGMGVSKPTRASRPWKSKSRMFPCGQLKEGTLVRVFTPAGELCRTATGAAGVQAWPIGGADNECIPHASIGVVLGRMDVYFADVSHGPDEYAVNVNGKLYALWRYQLRRVKGQ